MASLGCDFAFEIVVAAALEQDINKDLGLVCKAQIDTPHVSPSPGGSGRGLMIVSGDVSSPPHRVDHLSLPPFAPPLS